MINPKVKEIICEAVDGYVTDGDEVMIANAIIGSLAVNGFVVVEVDTDIARRVVAETQEKR